MLGETWVKHVFSLLSWAINEAAAPLWTGWYNSKWPTRSRDISLPWDDDDNGGGGGGGGDGDDGDDDGDDDDDDGDDDDDDDDDDDVYGGGGWRCRWWCQW